LRYCDRRFGQLQRVRAGSDLKFPRKQPGWRFHMFHAFVRRAAVSSSIWAQWPSHRAQSVGTQLHLCAGLCSNVSITLVRYSRFARELQGGGVNVQGGTVAVSSCTISGNTATYVRAHVQKFPLPMGDLTFYSLSAGWRCQRRRWHSGGLIVHHQWEHSYSICARNIAKFPMALVG
jgi:hypothetical protein